VLDLVLGLSSRSNVGEGVVAGTVAIFCGRAAELVESTSGGYDDVYIAGFVAVLSKLAVFVGILSNCDDPVAAFAESIASCSRNAAICVEVNCSSRWACCSSSSYDSSILPIRTCDSRRSAYMCKGSVSFARGFIIANYLFLCCIKKKKKKKKYKNSNTFALHIISIVISIPSLPKNRYT
jgi:hypothetical protein